MSSSLGGVWPWDRWADETEPDHNLFRLYYDLGPERSIPSISRIAGMAEESVRGLAHRFSWESRARQREEYQKAMFSTFFQQELLSRETMIRAGIDEIVASQVARLMERISSGELDEMPIDRAVSLIERFTRATSMLKKVEKKEKGGTGKVWNINFIRPPMREEPETVSAEVLEAKAKQIEAAAKRIELDAEAAASALAAAVEASVDE